ncbi:hypothetical protein [Pseudomonas aeruginosa]|uniref:hypothetical protein n=1 Tax=Pseudomonas aeruginosa TaxID=287 RepID=UPI001ADC0BBB|nr:hypothetical protein [Pseudomonas aeruginosa]MBO8337090.1 hypothetical protein [Pseudomonas aeruginosa]HCF0590424.1 hypothetical protein [Pseudomonas aeruginosa]HCF4080865.1 hypothetical protein [Pseudomonas aeruginosa]HDV6123009.1 hypothetical protein [Pseudomonas aeruginosa]HDV6143887.1 hypothetical protein [Pseudomonas aeruginosa]
MRVNPKHPVSRAVRMTVAAVGIGALSLFSLYSIFRPQPAKVLELPGVAVSSVEEAESSVCVDGVRYLTAVGNPSAALLDQAGLARVCEGENSAGMGQFGHRYRTYCISGVQYVRFYERYSRGMFVRYDKVTRRPMACEIGSAKPQISS